jgi:hypothetical protein
MRKNAARVLIPVVAGVPVIVASCLDFSSLGGANPDASVDGSVAIDANDDNVSDSGSPDAATIFDAGPEAGFCASNPGHTLCDDFDDENFLTPWNSGRNLSEGGVGAQSSDTFVSSPFSYAATLPSIDASSSSWLINKFAIVPGEMTIEFDLYLASIGNSTTSVANIFFPNNFSFTLKLLTPSPPTLELVEVSPVDGGVIYKNVNSVNFAVSLGQWHHVLVDFVLTGANAGNIQIAFDHGTPIGTVAPNAFNFGAGGIVQLQAGVGSYSAAPFFSSSVRLDNYVVDTK